MIQFACSCGKALTVKDELAGKRVKCPSCGQIAVVSQLVGSLSPAPQDRTVPSTPASQGQLPISVPKVASEEATQSEVPHHDAMDTLAPGVKGEPQTELTDFLAPPQAPDELGRLGPYRVLKVLGAGGMGVVFKAQDPQLERIVALKAMLPALAKKTEAKQRFFREAKAVAALKHDHIVTIHQVGEDRGIPFLAMEFLEGEPLDTRLNRDHKLSIRETVRIGRQIAEGLAAAHDKGLIHRDIKPANIWLDASAGARVKILDFGLARTLADDVHLTHSGAIVGTPTYMAPEQARGDIVDHRCDLFSLGVVLYRMTTGRLPFRGDSTMAVLTSLAVDQPPAPGSMVGDLPAELSDLIMQLLSKDPSPPRLGAAVSDRLQRMDQRLGASTTDADEPKALAAKVDPSPDRRATDQQTQRITVAPPPRKASRKRLVAIAAVLGAAALLVLGLFLFPRTPTDAVTDDNKIGDQAPPSAAAVDPDHHAAEWVLSIGGKVRVNDENRELKAAADLPREGFRLTAVELHENTKVTDTGLAHFKDCKNLMSLDLSVTQAGDAGLDYFKNCKNLVILDLASTKVSDTGLAHFRDCKNLTTLNLCYTKTGDAGLAHFKGCKNLLSLRLHDTEVNDTGLAAFNDCKHLTELFLPAQASDAALAHFKNAKNLQVLGLNNAQVRDAGLAYVKECKNLTSVYLSHSQVGDAGLAYFKDCKSLASLDVSGTQVSDLGLANLKDCNNLALLTVLKTKATAAGIDTLKKALPECKIEWDGGVIEPVVVADPDRKAAEWVLSMGGMVRVNEQERDLRVAADLPPVSFRLTVADLQDKRLVNDVGLVAFQGCKSLTRLHLGGTQVTDAGLSHFKDCNNLTLLWLQSTQVSDAGLAHFKECKNVTHLSLNYTRVSDAGLVHFKDCKNLAFLELTGTKANDASLAYFKDCKNLTQLYAVNTQVSNGGLAHLKDCKNLAALRLGGTR